MTRRWSGNTLEQKIIKKTVVVERSQGSFATKLYRLQTTGYHFERKGPKGPKGRKRRTKDIKDQVEAIIIVEPVFGKKKEKSQNDHVVKVILLFFCLMCLIILSRLFLVSWRPFHRRLFHWKLVCSVRVLCLFVVSAGLLHGRWFNVDIVCGIGVEDGSREENKWHESSESWVERLLLFVEGNNNKDMKNGLFRR